MPKNKTAKSNKISEITQLGVLMEHIDEKVTLTAEHVSGLTKKVEGIDKKVSGLDKKVENLDVKVEGMSMRVEGMSMKVEGISMKVDDLDERMERVEKTLDNHTEMIGSLMVNMEVVKTDVEFIKSSLKKKVDAEEFEALVKRVSLLESRFLKH